MFFFLLFVAIYAAIVDGLIWRAFRRAKTDSPEITRWVFTRQALWKYRWIVFPGLLVVPTALAYLLDGRFRFTPLGRLVSGVIDFGVFAIAMVIIAGGLLLFFRFIRYLFAVPPAKKVKALRTFVSAPADVVNQWGATPEARLAAIRKAFDENTISLSAKAAESFRDNGRESTMKAYLGFEISRSLALMEPKAREMLRATEMLAAAGDNPDAYIWRRTALIWGGGKAAIDSYVYKMYSEEKGVKDALTMINWYMAKHAVSEEAVGTHILDAVNAPDSGNQLLNAVKSELRERLLGNVSLGSGPTSASSSAWLKSSDIPNSIFASRSPHTVTLGILDDGTPLTFSGDESLITIAPPGSGKTQCSVFPTLLRWKGPALVLDISGDIYEKTSKWRAENVGPVFKFAPLQPEQSHRYSPLSFVRSDPDYIWEDARLLAELMIVPSKAPDPFWENNARIFLTAAIAAVVYTTPADKRAMDIVLDAMHGGDAWEQMMTTLRLAVDVRAMTQHAISIGTMEEKTRDSVRQTARSSLAAWSGQRVARATSSTDWSPLDLRNGSNTTIYIVLQPQEVEGYLSLLRVFIGQHIRMLFSGGAPKHGSCPTLIMLDEMPRLKHMPPIDEALNIGRRFGLRLWMFAQSFGQIEEAYENAEGMVASCGVRIYMNPSAADGTAESISEQIGYRSGPMDGNRQLIVEPNVLAGTTFRDYQIVLGKGCKPAKVRKAMAWQDPEVSGRFGEFAVKK